MAYRPRRTTRRAAPRPARRKAPYRRYSRAVSSTRRNAPRRYSGGGVLKIVVEQRTADSGLGGLIDSLGHPVKPTQARKGRF